MLYAKKDNKKKEKIHVSSLFFYIIFCSKKVTTTRLAIIVANSLCSCYRLTLPSVYLVLATGVATGARAAATDPDNMTQTQGGNKVGRKVQAWSLVVEALEQLMAIAKTHETRPLLNAFFKVTRTFSLKT